MATGHVGLIAHGGGRITGNERYILELARVLTRRPDDLRYTIFYTREAAREKIDATNGRVRFRRIWPETPWLRLSVSLPLALRSSGVDLIHCQYGLPAFTDLPAIVIVHDVFFARLPHLYPAVQRLQLRFRVPRALTRARRVIVPSEFSKRDILDLYDVDEEKIDVVPLGVDRRFHPLGAAELEAIRQRYGLPEQFLLFVGAFVPRKNLVRLVRAFAELDRSRRRACPLLLAGSPGWMSESLDRAVGPLVAEGSVRFLGYIPDADLPGVMNLATALVCPSLAEGFGFPALEAMRCGTCVVASRVGSLPEHLGDAAVWVDPLDIDSIRAALIRIVDDAGLRSRLGAEGRARARQFTWERTAATVAGIFRRELTGSSAGRDNENGGRTRCLD